VTSRIVHKSFNNAFAFRDEVSTYIQSDDNKYLQGDSALHDAVKSIEKTALELCNDPQYDRIEFKIRKNGGVFIDTTDNKAYDCLLQSFERNKEIIPVNIKAIIEKILNTY
jgi:hypothetical protein